MRTVTYSQVFDLAARHAGRVSDTTSGGLAVPLSEAAMLRDYIGDHLEDVWEREAWPELVQPFEAVTVTDNAFTKTAGMGALLSLYAGGNPNTTTVCTRVKSWLDQDDTVRLTTELTGTIYAEYQDVTPTLPDYGDADLAATTLPARLLRPLAYLAAADLVEDEDPAKAERLRLRAERELNRQAARLQIPWWRQ